MENEQESIIRTLKGDSEAFDLLIKEYYSEIFAIAFSIVRNHLDAEELVQEAFVKAYLNLSRLRNPERFGAWLKSITRNVCRDWLRKQIQPFLPIDNLLNDQQLTLPPADENILKNEYNGALSESLSSLTYDDKMILRLYYVYGFGYEEIIRANRQSYSAVTSRLHKAKNRLKDAIKNQASPFMTEGVFAALSGGSGNMKIRLGKSQDILDGIKTVEYAQAKESGNKYNLNGIYIEFTKETGLGMVATDGKRLAVAQLHEICDNEEIPSEPTKRGFVILRDDVNVLKDALQKENMDVSIETIDESMTAFYIGEIKKLIQHEGKYPAYKDIISRDYQDSITIDKKSALDILEKAVDPSKEYSPIDLIQKENLVYVSPVYDAMKRFMTNWKAADLCHKLLGFVINEKSPDEIGKQIVDHLPPDEYQRLYNDLEKQKDPLKPTKPIGKLEILRSTGNAEFCCRINGQMLIDAIRAVTDDIITVYYNMPKGITLDSIATIEPVMLKDSRDNIHIVMPMRT